MKDKPNYYANITADVRYDKSLCANAKLLYAEITALTNKEGYCWASNGYFAELYEVDKRSVLRWIKSLSEAGYIEIDTKNDRRIIRVGGTTKMSHMTTKMSQGTTKMSQGGDKNVAAKKEKSAPEPVTEGAAEESVSPNTKSNIKKNTTVQGNPDLNQKPCDLYNYEYLGNMKGDETYFQRLEQTKKSYIAMLERDYGRPVQFTHKQNLLNGKKEKFFRALTTFLLEWDKQTPNKVKTYKDLVKTYYRRVFYNANEESAHARYRDNAPNPNQILTENSIDVWESWWVRNPMLTIKPKEVSNEVKIQQAKEKEKFGWYLEEINRFLFDNCHRMVMAGGAEKNKYLDMRDERDKIAEFRKESGVK